MTDTQQQLAASRMLTARLHVELARCRDHLDQSADAEDRVREINAALGHSEPEILARLADAERDVKVEQLNYAARRAVEVFQGNVEGMNVAEFITAMDALRESLLP